MLPLASLPEFVHEGPLHDVTHLAGKFADEWDYGRVLEASCRVVRDTGEPVLTLVKNAVPRELIAAAWSAGLDRWRPLTDNRSTAAASERIHERKKDGTYSKTMRMPRQDQVSSGVMGYYDRYPRIPYCRCCAFNEQHPEVWAACQPLIRAVNEVHRLYDTPSWQTLRDISKDCSKDFIIPGTVYSTITVNKNYRTAYHHDGRNVAEGKSAMLLIRQGKIKGGVLVLPAYKLGVPLETGDVVIFNGAADLHGNTFITPLTKDAQRCTLVHYFRKGMLECGTAEEELERAKNRPTEKLS
jgi:hypothetical protein